MKTNTDQPVINLPDKSYQRTPEDEERDQADSEWKKRRNDEAARAFYRNNPSGRIWPKQDKR